MPTAAELVDRAAQAIYDRGAYCGYCAYAGWDTCSQCRHLNRTYARAALAAIMATPAEHVYLSTGCFHGRHDHCRCTVNLEGQPKVPGRCKFCDSDCLCPCHATP